MLKQRIISAVAALIVLAIAVYYLEGPQLRWIVLAVWTLGAWEWSGFMPSLSKSQRLVYVGLLFVPMLIVALGYLSITVTQAILVGGVIFWIYSFFQILAFSKTFSGLFILLSGFMVIVPSYTAFDFLLKEYGLWHVLLLLLMIWAADVGAYFAGKGFGKNKLAPKVSPGKTREGVYGGLVLSLFIAILGAKFLIHVAWGQSFKYFLAIGVCVVFSSIVGDLTVSMFKRNAGVKDSGVFLPGHGGVMDRVDSLCAGVVFFTLCLTFLQPLVN